MGAPAMALSDEEIARIGQYIKKYLPQWTQEISQPLVPANTVVLERLIRLEEELKAQRELMESRFNEWDKRFEDLIHYMDKRFQAVDKRFESVDKRFEDLIHYMDKRFDAVDRRFSSIQWMMGIGFTLLAALMAVFNFF